MGEAVIESEYRPTEGESFMNDRQKEYFRNKLITWKNDILRESKETLDAFIEALIQVAKEAAAGEDILHQAPRNMPVSRVDEAKAVKDPQLCFRCQ